MTENRFKIVKTELDFYFDITDTEKRWEIGDVELDNLPCFEDLVDLLNEQHETIKRLKAYLLRYKGVIYEDLEYICNDERLSEWWADLE